MSAGTTRDWLRLGRVPLAPTAATDVLACALLARGPGFARGAEPLSLASAFALAATSILVYVAGMAGNDLADRERDRSTHPERPLPSGRIRPAQALVAIVLCAGGAVAWGGGPAGSRAMVVAALVCATVYDGWLKRFVVPGALAMGGVRASNALIGVLPLVLAGQAHVLVLAAPILLGLYSAATTVLSTAEESVAAERRGRLVAHAGAAVAFAGAGLLAWLGSAGPTLGAFLASGAVLSAAFGRVPKKGPVKAQVFEMLLGLYWLDAVLVSGAREGSAWGWSLPALGVAFALIYGTQIAARALRREIVR